MKAPPPGTPVATNGRVLVIEDDRSVGVSIELLLTSRGYGVVHVTTCTEGIERALTGAFDLVVTDLRLQDGSGLDVVTAIKASHEGVPVVVMTGYSSVETAVQALRHGAVDYLIKPYNNDEFVYAVERAISEWQMRRENALLKRNLRTLYESTSIIGESREIKRVLEVVRKVANTDATVYIRGESGTGKELVAQAIHRESSRSGAAFVAVNCGAIPSELVESELFGHVKGAFTSATSTSEGLMMEAQGGTLFLDEVGGLPLNVQIKLLRALQEREVRPVGGKEARRIDVRFIAASNKDLKQAVATGDFREDLFYRLNVINIHVPPLRERGGDVELLVRYFMKHYSRKMGKRIRELDSNFKAFVTSYHWPGNVRELQNLIERAAILADSDTLSFDDMSDEQLPDPAPANGIAIGGRPLTVEDYMRHVVTQYQATHNENEIARMLGIGRKALWVRRRRWAMSRSTPGSKAES
ncbi:MAG: sigma-54 dependent transcriptional regulator [Betaproteobacteria bacterium]